MAGERLAKLTIEASFALEAGTRGDQTAHVRLRLGGSWLDYYRGAYTQQHEFVVPDPADVQRAYVQQAVDNLLTLVKLDVQSRGLPYVVSDSRDVGNTLGSNLPRIQFDITATQYSPQYDLDFQSLYQGQPPGWTVLTNLTTSAAHQGAATRAAGGHLRLGHGQHLPGGLRW